MSLYTILLVGSIFFPIVLSFDKKLQFYKQWKYFIPSTFAVAIFYILFDIYFTSIGIWGFNLRYLSSITLINLPIEEWLFFILIPYASIFLHDSIILYHSEVRVPDKIARYITIGLFLFSLAIVLFNLDKTYTVYMFSLVIVVLVFSLFDKTKVINNFYYTYLAILVPFLIVNAVLTGSFIEEPIVWYDNTENLGIRFLTIPVEDFGYAFSLILFNLILRTKLKTLY